jgi:hypothetical protein
MCYSCTAVQLYSCTAVAHFIAWQKMKLIDFFSIQGFLTHPDENNSAVP